MSSSAKIVLDVTVLSILNSGVRAGVIPQKLQESLDLNTGTTDGSIDLAYCITETGKIASTAFSYDLAGALTNPVGDVCVFAEIVAIILRNKRTTALAYLDVGPHATAGFGRLAASRGFWPADVGADADQGNIVAPESWLCLYQKDGVPVTATTADILRVTTSGVAGATNSWDLIVLGRSA